MPRQRIIDICLFLLLAGLLCYEIFILKGNNYYVVSLIIILAGMMRFLLSFEKSHPSVQMMAVIAALCGLAIASRIAFFFLPQIKPMAAVVIITGIVFGGETGFITGAVTAFVSNFYFGQGSWTPFQMFALGLTGFLAGILFKKKHSRILVAVYGFFSVVILYGGIVDLNTIFMMSGEPDSGTIAGIYLSGLPFNILFGVSTAIFLYLLYQPVVRRLERICRRYQLIDKEAEK